MSQSVAVRNLPLRAVSAHALWRHEASVATMAIAGIAVLSLAWWWPLLSAGLTALDLSLAERVGGDAALALTVLGLFGELAGWLFAEQREFVLLLLLLAGEAWFYLGLAFLGPRLPAATMLAFALGYTALIRIAGVFGGPPSSAPGRAPPVRRRCG